MDLPESSSAAARLTPQQARLELALTLFQQERLSLGLASEMAGLRVADMMTEISRRRLSFHYGVEEFKEDFASLSQAPST